MKKQAHGLLPDGATGLLLAGFAVLGKLPMLTVPLNRDEGAYAMISRALLSGDLVYRDLVEFKPPLLYALYLPLALVPDGGPALMRTLALGYHVATTLLIWRLALALFGDPGRGAIRSIAVFAALIYAAAASDPNISGHLVSAEMLMNLFATAGVLVLLRRPDDGLRAGALLASAALVKQQAVTYLALPVLLPLLMKRPHAGAVVARVAAGAAAVFLVCALILAAAGLLVPAVEIYLWAGVHLVAQVPLAASFKDLAWSFQAVGQTQWPLWALAALGLASPGISRRTRMLLIVWIACVGLSLLIGRRPYQHHLQQLLPPLALAGAAGAARILLAARRPSWTGPAGIALAAGVLYSAWLLLPLLTSDREAKARMLYPVNSFLEAERVAAWLKKHTPAGSAVLIAGSEPEIPWLARRRLAGRYPLMYHLTAPAPGIEAEHERWLAEASAENPEAVVYCRSVKSWRDPSSSASVTKSLRDRVEAFLRSGNWKKAVVTGPFEIYVRRN